MAGDFARVKRKENRSSLCKLVSIGHAFFAVSISGWSSAIIVATEICTLMSVAVLAVQ